MKTNASLLRLPALVVFAALAGSAILRAQTSVVIPAGNSYTLNAATSTNYIVNAGDRVGFAGTSPVSVIMDAAGDTANWTLTNNGQIGYASIATVSAAGPYAGVYLMGTGLVALNNNGSIITGTDPGAARTAVGVNVTAGGQGSVINNTGLIWSNANGIRSVYDNGFFVTNSGTIIGSGLRNATAANHRAAISVERGGGTIANTGLVSGGTAGIVFLASGGESANGWLVTNSGTVSGSTGVSGVSSLGIHVVAGSGTLVNDGLVFGSYAGAMLMSATNTLVQNNAGGVIRSVATGNVSGPAGFVTSAVVVEGGSGNRVINDGGLISGGRRGITIFSSTGALVENKNSGTITNAADVGVAIDGTSTATVRNIEGGFIGNVAANTIGIYVATTSRADIYNDATARIEAGNNAIQLRGHGSIVNEGILRSNNVAVLQATTGTLVLDNRAGGLIASNTLSGVHLNNASQSGTIHNSGTITGFAAGVQSVANTLYIDNKVGGLISGGTYGIWLTGGTNTIINSGTVTGVTNGILINNANATFLIDNKTGGLIRNTASGNDGIVIDNGSGTISNSGLITGVRRGVTINANDVLVENTGTFANGTDVAIAFDGASSGTLRNISGGFIGNTASSVSGVYVAIGARAEIYNDATSLIEAGNNAALNLRGLNTVINDGVIRSANTTVYQTVSGTLFLDNRGLIAATAYNAVHINNLSQSATIYNSGTIDGFRSGILSVAGSLYLDNKTGGLVSSGTYGLWLTNGSGTVLNSGSITGATNGILITTATNYLIQNNAGGVIESTAATAYAIDIGVNGNITAGKGTQVINDGGLIKGAQNPLRIYASDIFIENKNSGTLQGDNTGIIFNGLTSGGTVVNTGSSLIIARHGITVQGAATIINSAGSQIAAAATGRAVIAYSVGSALTLLNTGTSLITSGERAVWLRAGTISDITNEDGAIISNTSDAYEAFQIEGDNALVTIANTSGAIITSASHTAIGIIGTNADVALTNASGATISGFIDAISIAATNTLALDNDALITGSAGVRSAGSLTLVNRSAGLIEGTGTAAILVNEGTAFITNSGMLRGAGGAAIVFAAGAQGSLTLDTGSVLEGDVVSASVAGNKLFLAGSGSEDANFTGDSAVAGSGFETLSMSGTAWTLSGRVTLTGAAADALSVNTGTLALTGALVRTNNAGFAVGSGGRLVLGLADTASLTASATLAAGGELEFAFATDSIFSGTIIGAGGIVKSGAARQTLSGLNTFTGQTLVNSGALIISGDASRLRGDITVASGATFGGQGSVGVAGKTITLQSGASLLVGDAAQAQTLVIDGALSASSASFLFDLHTGGTSDRLVIATGGSLTLMGSNTIAIGAFVSGTFNLGNIASLLGSEVTVGGLNVIDPTSRQNAALSASGDDLLLVASAGVSRLLRHTGEAGTFVWSTTDVAAIPFATGDTIVLDSLADAANSGNRDITFDGVFATVSDLVVSGTGDYTLRGAALIADRDSVVEGSTEITAAAATGRLVKTGAGRLALAGSGESNFKGGVELGGGVLALESAGSLGVSNLAVTGDGVLLEIASSGVDISGSVSLGAHDLAVDTTGRDAAISGAITGEGALVKRGEGTLALGGVNAFSGGLAIESGAVSAAAPAGFGTGVIDIATGGTLALSTTDAGDLAFAHALEGSGVFSVSLATGADYFSFAPAAAFSGELRLERGAMTLDTQTASAISSGVLRIGAAALVEKVSGDIVLGTLAFSGGTLALAQTEDGALDGVLSTVALDAGTGGVIALDTARLTADRDNPPVPPAPGIFESDVLTGIRLVSAGTVTGDAVFAIVDRETGDALPPTVQLNISQQGEVVAEAGYGHTVALQSTGDAQGLYLAHGLTSISIFDGKTLLVDNTGAPQSTLSAVLSGAGGVDIRAAADSPITLAAANTYTGPTRLLSGVVMVSNTGAFSRSESVTIAAGATLDISPTGANSRRTLVRELSGAGVIYLGNASLDIMVNGDTEFSGAITGSNGTLGRLYKTGTGTLTLSGDNRYGDRTYVNEGRVRVTSRTGLGNGAYAIIAPSAVLEFNGVDGGPQGKIWFDGGGRLEIINSTLDLEVPYNNLGALAISGRSLVTALGSTGTGVNWNGSLGGVNTDVTVGAGSTLAIAPRSVVAWGNIVPSSGTICAGSLALEGGTLRLDPGATLAVTNGVTIAGGGKIAFGGGGVSHLDAASFSTPGADPLANGALSLYEVPRGMALFITARAGGYDYTVVNQSASPLRAVNLTFNAISAALDAVDAHLDDRFLLPVADPIPDPRRTWTNTGWIKGLFSDADYEDNADRPGHSERMNGLIVGLDARTRRHLLVGIYAGMSGSDLDTTNELSIDSSQRFAGAYATVRFGAFYANAGVSTGKFDADVFREEPAGQIRGTYEGSHIAGVLGAGFVFDAWKGAKLKPSATLRYTKVKMRDYEERGPGAMLVPDFSDKLLQSIVRVRADQSFTIFGCPASATFSLGWRQALREPDSHLTAAFAANPECAISLSDTGESKASALIGLGVRAALGRATVISLDGEHEISADRVRDTCSLSVGYSW